MNTHTKACIELVRQRLPSDWVLMALDFISEFEFHVAVVLESLFCYGLVACWLRFVVKLSNRSVLVER